MKITLALILGAVFLKFLVNIAAWSRCKWYQRMYAEYFKKPNYEAYGYRQEIKRLLRNANVTEPFLPHVEPVGYNHVSTSTISVIDNMYKTNDGRIYGHMNGLFFEATGVFWRRAWNSFNPLSWIQIIIFLPREIIAYIGLPPEHWSTKVLQLVYWSGSVIAVIIKCWLNNHF